MLVVETDAAEIVLELLFEEIDILLMLQLLNDDACLLALFKFSA